MRSVIVSVFAAIALFGTTESLRVSENEGNYEINADVIII